MRDGVGGVATRRYSDIQMVGTVTSDFVLGPRYTIRCWVGRQIATFVTELDQSLTQPIAQLGIPYSNGSCH